MKDDKPSVQDAPIVSQDRVRDVIRKQLDIYVNVGRHTVEELASDSGVSKHAIRSYMRNDGTKEPSLARALSLAVCIGPRAVQAIMHLIGYEAQKLGNADEPRPMQIVADALGHFAVIGQAAADNIIDHTERPRTMEAADALIATIIPLSSARTRG